MTGEYKQPAATTPPEDSSTSDKARKQAEKAKGKAREVKGKAEDAAAKARGKAEDTATKARGKANEAAISVKDSAKSARDYTSERYQEARDYTAERYRTARDYSRERANEAREYGERRLSDAQAGYEKARTRASEGLESYPLAAAGLGLLAGMAIGLLLPRTRQESRVLGSYRDGLYDQAVEAARAARAAGEEEFRGIASEAKEHARELGDRAASAAKTSADAALKKAQA
ncbi:hypothetical protein B5C34_14185 [Pacificimonas flava]|uniref:DUF883 domain-containing protein n=2 Tax=Pacificimonas TaxID=1960290 RepID=A0A219B7X7_9SPHN|nr:MULTISPECIES: hypothetical protein [Pacificimonas]MBZ6379973.1 hypothetical protein [Pacificimonas aurantium]OWV34492.1 hypothetical protein B5C34_14185 [Pacificimonas flava]